MITFAINAERGYALITVQGRPILDDYLSACRGLAGHSDFVRETHRICDFTEIEDLEVSTAELLAFVNEAKQLPTADSTRVALIAKDARDRGMMQLFSSHFRTGSFRTFEKRSEALGWVLEVERTQPPAAQTSGIQQHHVTGDLDFHSILEMQKSWFEDPEYDPTTSVLWDLRKARMNVDRAAMKKTADRLFAAAKVFGREGKTAVLVDKKFNEILVREAIRDSEQVVTTRVMGSEREALDWLSEPLDQ